MRPSARARSPRLTADATTGGAQAIAESFESIRSNAEERAQAHVRGSCTASTSRPPSEANAMFTQAAERFADVIEGLKRMAAEMQQELETTRGELRRGILELPQETADSAAQMRRVIVDQIEALAELNRIVARHGRGIDAVEPPDARVRSRWRRRRGGHARGAALLPTAARGASGRARTI